MDAIRKLMDAADMLQEALRELGIKDPTVLLGSSEDGAKLTAAFSTDQTYTVPVHGTDKLATPKNQARLVGLKFHWPDHN